MLLGSLAFSLAFNMSWAWGGSPLSVIAAAACTLIVPAGLHLWPLVPAANWKVRALRAVVMSGICTAAAVVSFLHAVDVLLANGWTPLTAWAVTGGAELLVALSTMALRQPAEHTEQAPVQAQEQTPVQPATKPEQPRNSRPEQPKKSAVQTERKLSAVKPDRTAEVLEWVLEQSTRPSSYAIREQFKCGHATATAALKEYDELTRKVAVG